MKFCDTCGSCMQRFVDNDAIIYKCACGMIYDGDAMDACVYSESFDIIGTGNTTTDLESNRQFISNAAFDPTSSIIKSSKCECGRDYRSQVIITDNVKMYEICKCGRSK